MRARIVFCLVSALLAVSACGSGDPSPASAPGPASPSASPAQTSAPATAIPEDLVGLFKTVVTLGDLKRLNDPHYDHHPEEITGTQYLEIRADGTYLFYEDRPERPVIRGSIEADGSQLTFSDETAAIAAFIPCPGSGTYAWKRAGDKIAFENVDDRCLKIGRIAIMVSSPFREV